MAKITHDKIAEKDILGPLKKEFRDVIELTVEATAALTKFHKELGDKVTIDSAKDLERLSEITAEITIQETQLIALEKKQAVIQEKAIKALRDRQKETENLNKTQKEKLKLQKELKRANSDSIQDNEEIKVQLQEQRKINKKIAKDRLGLISAYDKESDTLNRLRKKYKDLAVQNKENTDEGKDLLKNITKLDKKLKDIDDTVGQNQRSVGKYSKAFEGLNATIGKLGVIALLTKGLQFLGDVFGDSREGALSLEIAFSKFTETAKVFVNSVIESFSGVKDFFSAIGDSFTAISVRVDLAFKKMDRSISILPGTISRLDGEIKQLEDQLLELGKSSVSDAIDKITGAFDNNVKVTSKAIDAQEEFLKLQLATRISIEQQEKALAGLAEKRQILQDISDDDTIGFVTRAKAVRRAQEAAVEFAALENRLALTKERLTIEAVKQDLRRAKALSESALAQIKTGEQLQRILLNSTLARKVSDSNDEAFTAAFVERRDKEVEAQSFARDQEEKNRKTARDDFEQELDILEEFTEKRVASNEKIINSDSASLEERQKALTENRKVEKELLDASIDLIIEQGKASIDLRKDLTAAEKEHQKALLSTESIQEIINEQDAQEIFNLIRKLDLGEIEEKRLKETLKIKQDISEVNKESLKAEQDAISKTKELQEDIALQERLLSGELIDIEDERLDNEKRNLEERIDLLKENSIERLGLQKELNDLLIDAEKDKNEKLANEEKKLNDEKIERRQDFINQVGEEVVNNLDKQNEAQNDATDAEIARLEESVAEQARIAEEGGANIEADEKSRLDKARLRKKREAKKQAQEEQAIALALAYVNAFAERAKDDPDTAAGKALADVLLAKGVAALITGSAYEGTEDTGTTANPLDNKGGRIMMLHDNERIMSAAQNKMTKGMSNEDLSQLAQDYHNGNTWGLMQKAQPVKEGQNFIKEMEAFADSIDHSLQKYQSSTTFDVDAMGRIIATTVKNGIKTVTKYKAPRF